MRIQGRIIILILVVIMVVGHSVIIFAEVNKAKWQVIKLGTRVNAFKGEIDLSELDIKEEEIIGFDILKGSKRANLFYGVEGTKVKFASEMQLNTDYSLRVITNTKNYDIKFKSSDLPDIKETGEAIIVKVPAMPEKGFNWPYYLRIPSNQYKKENIGSKRYLMIDTPNGGTRDLVAAEKWTKDTLINRNQYSVSVAEYLWTPMLMPAYPNLNVGYYHEGADYFSYEHALDRETATLHLKLKDQKLKEKILSGYEEKGFDANDFAKLDEQLIAMFNHAVEYLNKYGHKVEKDKMFLNGYSATGSFTDRFTAIHPEKVKAVASGGTLDHMILPLDTYKGEKLIFPIGTYDFNEITGKSFNLKRHGEVARLIYRGDKDDNNTVERGYLDCYSEAERLMIVKLWGLDPTPRARALMELYGKNGGKGILILDKDIKHSMSKDIRDYIVEFFKANRDSNTPVYPTPKNPKQLEYKIYK